MTKQLRKDPVTTYNLLRANRADLKSALQDAIARGDLEVISALYENINKIDAAIEKQASLVQAAVTSAEIKTDAVVADPGTVRPADEEEDESPVAMPSKIRKEMGDLAADFLDDYANTLYEAAHAYFTDLEAKALKLGEESEEGTLRAILREQVGKLGVARVEAVFPEWRAATVKSLFKSLTALFEAPEPPPAEPAVETPAEAPEGGEEGDEVVDEAPADAEPEAPAEAPVEASVPQEPVIVASKVGLRVSAKVRDFRPAGQGPVKLT